MLRDKLRLLIVFSLLTWMGVILFLSSRSSLPADAPAVKWLGQYQDEVGHLGEYAILGLLTYVFLSFSMVRRRAVLVGLAFCVFFALGDEAFQGLIPNRVSEFKDILLDALGATSGMGAAALIRTLSRRYFQRPGASSELDETPHSPTVGSPGK